MTETVFAALETETVSGWRRGEPDANGCAPERAISNGHGNPCRHCLNFIPEGQEMLVIAHRPFPSPQPYAETGPIFVCADDCPRWSGPGTPPIFRDGGEKRLLKGYSPEDRIVYGLGRIVPPGEITAQAEEILADGRVAYVHVRSSTNNCFTCRIDGS